MSEWGVSKHGAVLHIDEQMPIDEERPLIIDVETDEQDTFVGMGMTQTGKDVYYYSHLSPIDVEILGRVQLVGHNIKFDAKLLVKWGISLTSERLKDDTILMSYVMDTTKESHSLKALGKEMGYDWPEYRQIVGSGKKKMTLDKQPLDLVANYCGMDVLVTYQLYQNLKRKMDLNASRIYSQIEMPLMRILFEMELQGVLVDVEKLKRLDREFSGTLSRLRNLLVSLAGKEINPNSNKQVAEVLTGFGLSLPKTPKGNLKVDKWTLEQYQDTEFVKTLMEYNKIEKLVSTYTLGLLKRETLPKVYTTYNQITGQGTGGNEAGISTGRLSSSNPNLQQIPTRTDEGRLLRDLFIPRPGSVLIDADYSQIEYRLLAHFSKEPILLEAFRNGEDIHAATGRALGVDRDTGKTLNFASIYGAQAAKIARTAKVTEEEAQSFINKYWQKLPSVKAWIARVKHEAAKKGGIFTFMKRWIPIEGFDSNNKYERFHAERLAVNYTIQGSAAEVIKLAMIQLKVCGYLPLLTVHDELLFEVDPSSYYGNGVTHAQDEIKAIMEDAVKLDIPLVADVGTGENWRIAKGD